MVLKNTHPGQDGLFPTQFELFSKMANRQELALDVRPESTPVSPAIQAVL